MNPQQRLSILTSLLGGPLGCEDDGQRLVLRCAVRDGCGGIFMLLWLLIWSYGTGTVGLDFIRHPDLRTGLVLALLGGIELAVIGFVLMSLMRREELIVEGDQLLFAWYVLIPIRRRRCALGYLQNIDLGEGPRGRGQTRGRTAIRISMMDGRAFLFAEGTELGTLIRWSDQLRQRIGQLRGRELIAAPQLETARAQVQIRYQQALASAMAAVGVSSEEELHRADPAVQQAAARHLQWHYQAAEATDVQEEAASGIKGAAREAGSWLAAAVWCVVGVAWISATIGITASLVRERRSGMMLLVMPIFWVISIFFAFIILATVKVICDAIIGGLRWLLRGGRK